MISWNVWSQQGCWEGREEAHWLSAAVMVRDTAPSQAQLAAKRPGTPHDGLKMMQMLLD